MGKKGRPRQVLTNQHPCRKIPDRGALFSVRHHSTYLGIWRSDPCLSIAGTLSIRLPHQEPEKKFEATYCFPFLRHSGQAGAGVCLSPVRLQHIYTIQTRTRTRTHTHTHAACCHALSPTYALLSPPSSRRVLSHAIDTLRMKSAVF